MTVSVQLYMKPGCHLCEDTFADLARLQRRHPHIVELVDITTDDELIRRYGERIPVVVAGGREYDAPHTSADLERALTHAAESPQRTPNRTGARE